MNLFNRFPIDYQMDSHDCGPSCLKMIAKCYGKYYSLQYLRDKCGITREGVSLLDLSTGAEGIGLRTLSVKCTLRDLVEKVPLPAIAFWNGNHFVVVYDATSRYVYVADPMKGRTKYTHEEFAHGWLLDGEDVGVMLAIEPTADFSAGQEEQKQRKDSFLSVLRYFAPYRGNFVLVFGIMLVVTLLQGVLPFISKAVIDVGIKTSDTDFILLVSGKTF